MVVVRPGLELRQRQTLGLTPAMRQSLQLLRLPALDLMQEITREADENPFLRIERPVIPGTVSAFDVALETVAFHPSLGESLRQQIGTMPLPADIRAVADYLTGELREDGYLDATLDEIAETSGLEPALLEAGLAALQRCEPTGVGARSLAECLALQLGDHGIALPLAQAIIARLPLFTEKRWHRLTQLLDLPESELLRIAGLLRRLDPQPVKEPADLAPPLLPDLVLELGPDGAPRVSLSREADPGLALNDTLLAQLGQSEDPFIQSNRMRAEALIRAIRARGSTLLRIGRQIASDQLRFFTEGPEFIVPMNRRRMAEELSLHPSTVGRAVAGKAIAAGGALYPLSLFFSTAVPIETGETLSSHTIRLHIRRLIEAEPADMPLSDQRICALLRDVGVDISRRTVAKYRGCMRIPSSSERRRRRA